MGKEKISLQNINTEENNNPFNEIVTVVEMQKSVHIEKLMKS